MKRPPRTCWYYSQYLRCKFGSFCSFSHQTPEKEHHEYENMNAKVNKLEERVKNQETEIELMKVTIREADERIMIIWKCS